MMTDHPHAMTPWRDTQPGQLVAKGHGAGDLLEAYDWQILEERAGFLTVRANLPDALRNPQGQLFGGFTPTYVDLVSIYTVHSGNRSTDPTSARTWLTTINMRCDYFEPIVEPTFTITGEIVNQRGRTSLVSTKFFQGEMLAAHAITTLREITLD